MKKIFFIGIFLVSILISTEKVSAAEIETVNNNTLIYDLTEGGRQEYEGIDDNNEQFIIEIEEIVDNAQTHISSTVSTMSSGVKTGTYKISKKRPLQWEASFNIDVNNSNIVRAHTPSAVSISGSFKKTSLKIDNSKQATYYLKRKFGLVESNINLRAKLINNQIVISY